MSLSLSLSLTSSGSSYTTWGAQCCIVRPLPLLLLLQATHPLPTQCHFPLAHGGGIIITPSPLGPMVCKVYGMYGGGTSHASGQREACAVSLLPGRRLTGTPHYSATGCPPFARLLSLLGLKRRRSLSCLSVRLSVALQTGRQQQRHCHYPLKVLPVRQEEQEGTNSSSSTGPVLRT